MLFYLFFCKNYFVKLMSATICNNWLKQIHQSEKFEANLGKWASKTAHL